MYVNHIGWHPQSLDGPASDPLELVTDGLELQMVRLNPGDYTSQAALQLAVVITMLGFGCRPLTMPADLSGTWNLLSSDNFEGYMLALGIDFATRKIAKLLKPQKVIEQNGDSFTIHTYSSLRNYLVIFKVGEEFEEDNKGLDNRKCMEMFCEGQVCKQTFQRA
ncbi:retinol binding protein 7 cellular [Cricetulus griseus]